MPLRMTSFAVLLSFLGVSETTSAEWIKEVVFQGAAKPSLAIGADNQPRIAFMVEAMPGFVSLAERRDGVWTQESVASGYFYGPLDVIMRGASPIINFHNHDLEDQVVAIRGELGWSLTPIAHPGHDGWDNTLGIDPSGRLHTLTTDPMDFGGPGLEYATFDGAAWQVEEVGSGPITYAEGLSLTFANDGAAHISYHNSPERSLYHGVRREGRWQLTRVDSGPNAGMFSSIAIASDGMPLISYIRLTSEGAEVRLATLQNGQWQSELIDTVLDLTVGFAFARNATSLRVDPAGMLHVAYSGESTIKYAKRNDLAWEIETIDTIAANVGTRFGQQVDLERDASGGWHLVSFDVVRGNPLSGNILYYRKQVANDRSPSIRD